MQEEWAVDISVFAAVTHYGALTLNFVTFTKGQHGTNEYGVEGNILTVDNSVTSRQTSWL